MLEQPRPALRAPGASSFAVAYLDTGCFNEAAGLPVNW